MMSAARAAPAPAEVAVVRPVADREPADHRHEQRGEADQGINSVSANRALVPTTAADRRRGRCVSG